MFIISWNIQNKPRRLFSIHKNSTVTAPAIAFKKLLKEQATDWSGKTAGSGWNSLLLKCIVEQIILVSLMLTTALLTKSVGLQE